MTARLGDCWLLWVLLIVPFLDTKTLYLILVGGVDTYPVNIVLPYITLLVTISYQ